jgi:YYY domain-containing protein
MTDAFVWWLAIELIGLAAFPIAFVAFRSLADRGFSFAKTVGIMLVAYALWLGGSSTLVPNERWTIVVIVAAMAAVSAWIVSRKRAEIIEFLKQRWAHLLFLELVFVALFAGALFLRSHVADLEGSERPTDSGIINAIIRADSFPPEDPWLSGNDINYYYFGHVEVATLSKLTAIPTRVSFNLAIASVVALAGLGAAGVAYNLIVARVRWRYAYLFAALAPLFFVAMSNIEGLFEMMAAHGIGSEGFYDALGIRGLDGPRETTKWYPTEPFWWGRANAYMSGWGDRLLPFNRLLIADLHSEILAMPMAMLLIGLGLNLWRGAGDRAGRWPRRRDVAFLSLALGAAAFTMLWDLPTYLLMFVAVFALASLHRDGRLSWGLMGRSALFAVVVLALAILLFLPAYLLSYGAFNGIETTKPNEATDLHHFLYQWLAVLGLVGAVLAVTLGRPRGAWPLAVAFGLLLLIVLAPWTVMTISDVGLSGLFDQLYDRGSNLLTVALVATLLGLVGVALWRQLTAEREEEAGPPVAAFPLVLCGIALLLMLGVEFYWIKDPYWVPRFNTLNKISFQGWALASAAGAFAIAYAASRFPFRKVVPAVASGALALVLTAFVLAGFVYPVTATFHVTDSFNRERYLDGLTFIQRNRPGDYEAILWLGDNVEGTPVVLEAVGDSHTSWGQVSAYTGLPTVLGWPLHQFFFRGSYEPQGTRRNDVKAAYLSSDAERVRSILERYDVEYVYVGPLEREAYGQIDMSTLAQMGEAVYENGDVTIFRVSDDGPARTAGARP